MSRIATHAGSWYSSSPTQLHNELTQYLDQACTKHKYPIHKSQICVSPHAGYTYCGPTMAHSFASLDLNHEDTLPLRFFILGPSHHFYFRNTVMLSSFDEVDTPFGSLKIDQPLCKEWDEGKDTSAMFDLLTSEDDEAEHSLEMQFSMLYATLKYRKIQDISKNVKIIPMMISNNNDNINDKLSEILFKEFNNLKYHNYIIISSDFCHWGKRFGYTAYASDEEDIKETMSEQGGDDLELLTSRSKLDHHGIKIWESISLLDHFGMNILKEMNYNKWKLYLDATGNTICGQHPLKLLIKMIENTKNLKKYEWHWLNYSQSSHAQKITDSSVSYSSGCITIM
ncbi:similar to Saccharomyces cerevisiae YJR008W Putative protein of unknown function [Maudiozyma saulgeensis]|uniref:MEMO1 family protein n=1 Tax=Maudiozyma saulgeensis TaxID=1789683 RepID=A0A1X7R544_9SACH|nr:similar to Saccharomyces cerevisiae YJR008W Putative protein of unknown function [Kazachstania saulgeensis]